MKSFLHTLLVIAVIISVTTNLARATNITLDSNTTLDSSSTAGYTIIDGANPPTVVEVNEGAILESSGLFGEANFLVFDSSVLNINGGVIQATGQSDISINAVDESEVNLFDGSIHGNAEAFVISGNSTLNIHGGIITADTKTIDSFGQSTVNVHDGEFLAALRIAGNSTANIFGGSYTNSGVFGNRISETATANVFGGIFGGRNSLRVSDGGTLNLHGGVFIPVEDSLRLVFIEPATVHIFGTNLDISNNRLTGILEDGSPISVDLLIGGTPSLILHNVPEPSALFQSGFALLIGVRFLARKGGIVI